ncbi:hypothetical protein CVT25_005307 [Psilocybe cyanescens]|uniref:Uncharacterized protein n=1 Tax=Psilocybe cyanescens TaxID=93625 RepID=A0A409XRN0_PSICY|nr:hypothetical protein CVT25_005307 [Psilocybe cyanescens]
MGVGHKCLALRWVKAAADIDIAGTALSVVPDILNPVAPALGLYHYILGHLDRDWAFHNPNSHSILILFHRNRIE